MRVLTGARLLLMAGTLAAAPFGSLALAGDAEAGNEQSPGPQSAMTPEPAQPSSEATLVPAAFADLPHWLQDDHLAALRTFLRSCTELAKAEDAAPQDARVAALASACRAADDLKRPGRAAARTFFEQHFVPYRVAQKEGTGFLTGYYEPVLNGSRTPQGRFQTPLYRRPPDLVNLMAETERAAASAGGKLTHMRKTEAGLEPFPTRAEIERGALKGHGLELIYLEDPVDAFFMQVQGSGRIKLRDGGTVRLNYDGKNGYPYTSIGRYIVDKGFFTAEEITLQRLRAFLRADPQRAREVMWQNQSFVFFRELDPAVAAEGPLGAQSVPLTPGRSLAVDTVFHALGTPVYVTSPSLKLGGGEDGFHRLMIAQDVGSAIKGPQRGDIYYGSGDKAGRLAGTTKHEGSFFVLLPASLDSSAWQGKAATRKR